MRKISMEKQFIIVIIIIALFSCGFFFGLTCPTSQGETLTSKEDNLEERNTEYLKRIAIALEDIKWELRRIRK